MNHGAYFKIAMQNGIDFSTAFNMLCNLLTITSPHEEECLFDEVTVFQYQLEPDAENNGSNSDFDDFQSGD